MDSKRRKTLPKLTIHRDEARGLIFLDKPADVRLDVSLPSQPSLHDLVRNELGLIDGDYLTHCHQLDYATSGIICFALNKTGARLATSAFASRNTFKVYLALCDDKSEERIETVAMMDSNLKPDPEDFRGFKQVACETGGRPALTMALPLHSFLLDSERPVRLWALVPITGRTHQLRVHLAQRGLPIVGDATYNPTPDASRERMMLHAWSLKMKLSNEESIQVTTSNPFGSLLKQDVELPSIARIKEILMDSSFKHVVARKRFAGVVPYSKDPETNETCFLLRKAPKQMESKQRLTGSWFTAFWQAVTENDVDNSWGAASAFCKATGDTFANSETFEMRRDLFSARLRRSTYHIDLERISFFPRVDFVPEALLNGKGIHFKWIHLRNLSPVVSKQIDTWVLKTLQQIGPVLL